ncbi:MAG: reverse transcriptase domain-containing protein [Flavobacterium sp.]|nr:reverse transcriptase domain-containing protein [Flavobacterium sp.]
MNKPSWLKEKGYLHLSPSLELGTDSSKIVKKVTNKKYIESYAFYPLLHTVISDRKFKKGSSEKYTSNERKHTHYRLKTLHPVNNSKNRPIHYASHMDSLVFGYYANILKEGYESLLLNEPLQDQAVIAYRKIETFKGSEKGKSNIHFAKECFDEIKKRTLNGSEVSVLAIDLKSFFSTLDHKILKEQWCRILKEKELPKDHYRVFKACTKFNYVLLDDLRTGKNKNGRKAPYDESKLAYIRKKKGFKCFFESNEDFRKSIKNGDLPIYCNPFSKELPNGKLVKIGIPQGLPISAVLANLYLFDFDLEIVDRWVKTQNVYYRRYSDDIFIVCEKNLCSEIEEGINELEKKYEVKISKDKTEKFIFRNTAIANGNRRLECFRINADGKEVSSAMSYLGFEFRGYHTGIKSTNLAKYYRKIISTVKRKSKRILKLIEQNPNTKKAVFKNQIRKIYNLPVKFKDGDLTEQKLKKKMRYNLVLNNRGFYEFKFSERNNKKQANYHSYIKRCCDEFQTDSFQKQIKKSKHVAYSAINKYLNENSPIR